MASLLLDVNAWDLTVDSSGNIAVCTDPYSVAQDVACEARTFVGDCYYDPTRGVPYFAQILGKAPSLQFLKAQYVAAAMRAAEVTSAQCFLTGIVNRKLTGQIQASTASGGTQVVGF